MTHPLPGLDWLVKLGIGLIVATAGVLLIRPPRRGALRFALGIFTIEAAPWSPFVGSWPAAPPPGGST